MITYEAIGLVQLSGLGRRADGGFQAQVEWTPVPPADDLDGVVDRVELRRLLRRASDRDPAFVTGWRRAELPAPTELDDLAYSVVADDLLRRLAMPLSERIELMARPERERFQALIHQLRELADGTPPPPQTAQRLGRPLIDLPREGVPVLANNIWLTPGGVSTITASAFISDKAFAAGWLAFTVRPHRGPGRDGHPTAVALGHGQRRRVLLVDHGSDPARDHSCGAPGRGGPFARCPAPSAARPRSGLPAGRGTRRSRPTSSCCIAPTRDTRVIGTAPARLPAVAGESLHLVAGLDVMADRPTGLRRADGAGPAGDRLARPVSALTLALQSVADGRPLSEARAAAAEIAAAALHGDR